MSTSGGDRRDVLLETGSLGVEQFDGLEVLSVDLESGDVAALLPIVVGLDLGLIEQATVRASTGPHRLVMRVGSLDGGHVSIAHDGERWRLTVSRETIGAVLRLVTEAALGPLRADHLDLYDDEDEGRGVTIRCAGEVVLVDEAELRRRLEE